MSDWQAPTYDELGRIADSRNEIIKANEAEIARLLTLLSEAEQREKDARAKALEEAAKVAILTANHLTILPPSVRKFPEVGGIMAARILELRSPVEEKVDEVSG